MKKKFGELLLERRLITPEQLADALELQRRRGMRLGAALVARGHITETQLVDALSSALNLRVVDLTTVKVNPTAYKLVAPKFAIDHELFPYDIRKERGRRVLSIAMSDPLNYRVIDELSFMTDSLIEPALARASDIDVAIGRFYQLRHRDIGTEAHGRDVAGKDLLTLESMQDETTMTILRKGGAEEIVDVSTGKVVSPFVRSSDGALLENPEVKGLPTGPPIQARGQEISAVLLTEEVVDDGTPLEREAMPLGGVPIDAGTPTARPGPAGVPVAPVAYSAFPTAPPSSAAQDPNANPYFDAALGALLDAAGGAVNAEAFFRLERRFWALMRVLAKKGVLTSDDFMKELGEEDR